MSSGFSILKNTLALAVPNVLNPIVSFALILVISRYMGVEGLGAYSLVLSYFGLFATLASLGLADLVVREAARKPHETHSLFANALAFGSISSAISLFGMNVLVMLMGYERDLVIASFVCSLALIVSTAVSYLEAIFRSEEKSEYVAFCFLFENAIRVAVSVLLLIAGYGITMLFVAVLASRVLGFFALFSFYLKLFGKPIWHFNRDTWRLLYRQSATFASIAIFSTIHLSIDQILLSKLQSIESVGIYSAADRLLSICKTLPVSFASALLPFFTRSFAHGSDELLRLITRSLGYILVLVLPLTVGTFILSGNFIHIIFGEKFVRAGPVLQVHILSLIPFSMVFVLAQVLIATDNQAVDLTINIVAAVMNFVLNLILIPYLAEIGAVLATLLTIIVFNSLQNLYIRKRLFHIPFGDVYMRPLIAAGIMGCVTYALKDFNVFLNVGVSAIVYAAAAILLRAIAVEDLKSITSVFSAGKAE
ncbi:flippase [Desulfomonile tiedjei]|uniref:Membrane protein involved in the export of O-antigen and teichoic acid n=1 Tax=Desulfomonile tiedjei (strain ATCC 49306 / DSM 6799 / DCB-1) TaxID=706587 RepID=I4C277_DESTA|nr:flippase [Desulfomonile tiedjei]AFM23668.1 membrane protein involved in the export of O-antigen and teichoic acid [Desulfomonile tiedjei DSM 6799]